MTSRTVGLVGITLVGAFAGISGAAVDFTASHVYNPAKPRLQPSLAGPTRSSTGISRSLAPCSS
jgi:hypothetical protein